MPIRPRHILLAALGGGALALLAPPAAAQEAKDGGVPTETQARLASGQDQSFDWNWLGLFGLFGLAGLRHRPDYSHAV
jgi:hypothetical protein